MHGVHVHVYVHELSTDQLQVYSLPGYDNVCQREGEEDSSDVRQIEIITSTGMLHYHQCLELIDMSHKVTLCIMRERGQREEGGKTWSVGGIEVRGNEAGRERERERALVDW